MSVSIVVDELDNGCDIGIVMDETSGSGDVSYGGRGRNEDIVTQTLYDCIVLSNIIVLL